MKMNVAYLRVSSDEQREQKTIETQRTEVQKAGKARAIKLDRIYEDDGVSGTIPAHKRPAASQLLEDAAAGRIGEIYIWKFDRLGRNLRDFLNLCHKLDRFGVHIESVTQPVPKGPAGRMMMQMLGAFAELDRENILENTRRGLAGKAARGGWTGGPVPFGYRVQGEKHDARLVKHEAHADLVRRLFTGAANGKSCQVLADYLNEKGVPTSRQNPGSIWRPNSVRVILTNPIYMGTRLWGRRQWVKVEDEFGNETTHLAMTPDRAIQSSCPVLVDAKLWEQANAALKANQIVAMAHAKNEYLLRGLITCGLCGSKYTGRGTCYSCIGRHCARRLYGKNKKRCPAPLVYRAELEDAIWGLCEVYISNPEKAALELAREMDKEARPTRRIADEVRREEERLVRNATAREKARIQNQEGWSSRDEFLRDMQRLAEQRSHIEARLAELRTKSADRESQARSLSAVRSVLEELRARVKGEFKFADRRRIVEALVAGVTVLPTGECRIDFHFHCEAPGWRHGVPATDAEVRAGAKGLRVTLEATAERCGFTSCAGPGIGTRTGRLHFPALPSSARRPRFRWDRRRSSI